MAEIDINNLELDEVSIEEVTNDTKTGVFDKLMVSVNTNIEEQYQQGRIDSNDFATVYLGSIQSVLAQSVQFVLQRQLNDVQAANLIKDGTLKEEQIANMYTERVLKDKEAAKLGLDNVMKKAEQNKLADENYVYEPFYSQEEE